LESENSALKSLLSRCLPYNESCLQSLSFYRIQYHLLKKKFSSISLISQQKNVRALEETVAQLQKQVIESEAYQHYDGKDENTLIEEILDSKMEIKEIREKNAELEMEVEKLRKKMELHRELEYYKLKANIPEMELNDTKIGYQSQAHTSARKNGDDTLVIQKLLNDVNVLTETINENTDKFDNEKLLNLYQNKEKLLNDKRCELVELQAVCEEIKEEKQYIEKQFLDYDHNEASLPDQQMLYELLKFNQKERRFYKEKLKKTEQALNELKINYYIMEEKDQIWRREREFYIKQYSSLTAEVENSRDLIIQMENHINTLNTLLLPSEYIQSDRGSTLNPSSNPDDSDSSYDDMLKDFGSVSTPSLPFQPTLPLRSRLLSHLDFLNCRKTLALLKAETAEAAENLR